MQLGKVNQAADASQAILTDSGMFDLRAGPYMCSEAFEDLPAELQAEFTEIPLEDTVEKELGMRCLDSRDVQLIVMKGGGYGPADKENILEIRLKTDRYHTPRGLYVGAPGSLDTKLYGADDSFNVDAVRQEVTSDIRNGVIREIVIHTAV